MVVIGLRNSVGPSDGAILCVRTVPGTSDAVAAWGTRSFVAGQERFHRRSLTVGARVVTVMPRAVVVVLRTHIRPNSIKKKANDIGTHTLHLLHHAGHRAAVRAPRTGDNDHAIRKGC